MDPLPCYHFAGRVKNRIKPFDILDDSSGTPDDKPADDEAIEMREFSIVPQNVSSRE